MGDRQPARKAQSDIFMWKTALVPRKPPASSAAGRGSGGLHWREDIRCDFAVADAGSDSAPDLEASRLAAELYSRTGSTTRDSRVGLDDSSETVTIGTVATLRREKNISRLIEAFGKVKTGNPSGKFGLIIVGDGPERPGLQALAASLIFQIMFCLRVLPSGRKTGCARWTSSRFRPIPNRCRLACWKRWQRACPLRRPRVGDVAKMVAEANIPFVVDAGPAFEQALENFGRKLCASADKSERRMPSARPNCSTKPSWRRDMPNLSVEPRQQRCEIFLSVLPWSAASRIFRHSDAWLAGRRDLICRRIMASAMEARIPLNQ